MSPATNQVINEVRAEMASLTELLTALEAYAERKQAVPEPTPENPIQKQHHGGGRKRAGRPAVRAVKGKRGPYQKRGESPAIPTGPDHPEKPAPPKLAGTIDTMGKAMKVEIARLAPKFTRAELWTAIEQRYGQEDFVAKAQGNNFDGNLHYWAKTGKLEKTGNGAEAAFKVVDKDFFNPTEP